MKREKIITAIVLGDPEAQHHRRPPTPHEMKHTSRRDGTHHVAIDGISSAIKKRAATMKIGQVVNGLTRSRAMHFQRYLVSLSRKGRRSSDGAGLYTVERIA